MTSKRGIKALSNATTATQSTPTGAATTASAARCGDSVVRAGVEDCDDGNEVQTDACLNSCRFARCGDGVVEENVEACDDGNRFETDACRNNCQPARCGDGVVYEGVEACDDGNGAQTDACLTSCVAARCGDGVVHAGVEACDDGNQVQTDGCLNDCVAARCGDGVVEAGEEACDDGNNNNDDQCQNDCTQTPSGSTQDRAARSCKAILDAGASTGSKAYWIDPNGGGTDDAFQTWCDMTTPRGGWTLMAKLTNADGSNWHAHSARWVDTSTFGTMTNLSNADGKSQAYNSLAVREVMVTSSNNANQVVSVGNCLNDWTFRTLFRRNSEEGNCAHACGTVARSGVGKVKLVKTGPCAFAAVIATG